MTNTKQNLRHAFDKFLSGQIIAMQFYVYFLNFQIVKNLDAKFKYFFRLLNVYLVQPTEKPEISMLSRRKYSPDKQIILPLRAKNGPKFINPLKWLTNNYPSQNTPHVKDFKETRVLGKRQIVEKAEKKRANKIIIDFIY